MHSQLLSSMNAVRTEIKQNKKTWVFKERTKKYRNSIKTNKINGA